MRIRAIDENGDWKFGKGIQDYLLDLEGLKVNLKTRLKSWKGDCFFALTEGVDYNNFLDLGTKSFLDRDIKRVILQTEGVILIKTFTSTLDRDSRDLTIECNIVTIFGVLNLGVTV